MRKQGYFFYLIGLIGFFLLLRLMDWPAALLILRSLDMWIVSAVVIVSLAIQGVKAFRWRMLLEMIGCHLSFIDALRIYIIGTFWGTITPGRVGDFCRIFYARKLSKERIPGGQIMASVIADRLMELAVIFFIIAIGLFGYLPFHLVWVMIIVVCMVLGLLYKFRQYFRKGFLMILERFDGFQQLISLRKQGGDLWQGFHLLRCLTIWRPLACNLVAYILFYAGIFALALALRFSVSFFYMCFAVSAAMAVSLLPISVAGLGSRDAALFLLFSSRGISYEETLCFSFVYLLIFLLVPSFMGMLIYLFTSKIYGHFFVQDGTGCDKI